MKKIFTLILFLLTLNLSNALARTQHKFSIEFSSTSFLFDRNDFEINEYETLDLRYLFYYNNQKNFALTLDNRLRIDFLDFSRNRYLPNETYLTLYGESVDFKMGLMQKSWGNGVIFNPTDILNRRDLESNYFLREKLADVMAQLSWSTLDLKPFDEFGITLTILPLFFETPLPNDDMRFAISGEQNNISYSLFPDSEQPEGFDRLGASLQIGFTAKALDFEIVGYHGPQKDPGYYLKIDDNGALRLAPFYYTIDMIGAHAKLTLNKLQLKTSAGYFMTFANAQKPHEIQPVENDAIPPSRLTYLVGFDYNLEPQNSSYTLTFSTEYFGDVQEEYAFFNPNLFQNDILAAFRYQSTRSSQASIQLGVLKDLENREWVVLMDASTLILKKIRMGAQVFYYEIAEGSALDNFSNNSFVKGYLSYTWSKSSES